MRALRLADPSHFTRGMILVGLRRSKANAQCCDTARGDVPNSSAFHPMIDMRYRSQWCHGRTSCSLDHLVGRVASSEVRTISNRLAPANLEVDHQLFKGAGEAGATGAPPAVVGAILDALRPLGITPTDMPATPNKIWHALQSASAAEAWSAE